MRIVHDITEQPVVHITVENGMAPVYGEVQLDSTSDGADLCTWLATAKPTGLTPVVTTPTCRPLRQFWVRAGERQFLIDSPLDTHEVQAIHTMVAEHFGLG